MGCLVCPRRPRVRRLSVNALAAASWGPNLGAAAGFCIASASLRLDGDLVGTLDGSPGNARDRVIASAVWEAHDNALAAGGNHLGIRHPRVLDARSKFMLVVRSPGRLGVNPGFCSRTGSAARILVTGAASVPLKDDCAGHRNVGLLESATQAIGYNRLAAATDQGTGLHGRLGGAQRRS